MPINRTMPLLVAACLLLLTATVPAVAAPLSDADCKAIFIKANQQMLKANSYHMTLDMTASVPMNGKKSTIAFTADSDFQVKPLLMKNIMNIRMETAGKKHELAVLQYCEETGGKLVYYSLIEKKWVKNIAPLPYGDKDKLNKYFESVLQQTEVSFLRETDDELVLEATVSADSLRESVEKTLELQGEKNVKLPADIFQDIDDLKYIVMIDKKTQTITGVSIDMTGLLRSIGEKILAAAQMPEDKKAPFREILAGGTVQMDIIVSRLNGIDTISIPKEARNAPLAPEAKPGKPDAQPPAKSPSTAAGPSQPPESTSTSK
jgi:hypothetical protein